MDWLAVFSAQQVEGWFEWGGYFILFGLLFACGIGLPLPEDIPLLLAGWFIAQGKMNLFVAAIVAWCGIIGGDCMLYHFGRRYGLEITRVKFIGKHLTKERILRAEELFENYGTWVVAVGRMFAGIRGAMVVAAGATRFNFVRFVVADGLAAIVSGGLFVWLGHLAGTKLGSIDEMRRKIKGVEHWVILGAIVVVTGFVLWLWLRKKSHKPALADVALTKVAEKAHQRHDAAVAAATGATEPPTAPNDVPAGSGPSPATRESSPPA